MKIIEKAIRADAKRRTRFHTARGEFCKDPAEIARAAFSTFNRAVFSRYEPVPWLVRSALCKLTPYLHSSDVFEFGSGYSTVWYANRARTVTSVESDKAWFEKVSEMASGLKNCKIVYVEDKEAYPQEVNNHLNSYNVIIIDGINRFECVENAVRKLAPGGVLLIDNTDVHPELIDRAAELASFEVTRYSGYAPGILHANETAILVRRD